MTPSLFKLNIFSQVSIHYKIIKFSFSTRKVDFHLYLLLLRRYFKALLMKSQKLFNKFQKNIFHYSSKIKAFSFQKKRLRPIQEIYFGKYGGAEYFFADVDGDGKLEIITYQGPGVFGAKIYRELEYIKPYFPKTVSISVFKFDGSLMWTWGEPNPFNSSYISHSCECCVDCADIDGDGENEIVIADGDRVVVLNGKTGLQKKTCNLPNDNYYIIKALGEPTTSTEAAIVVKNGESGYDNWNYGEPVIGLNSELDIVWGPKAFIGGGHQIITLDLRGSCRKIYMTGYSTFTPDGKVFWTVDKIDATHFDSDLMHADFIDVFEDVNNKKFIAIAGSNILYLVSDEGNTIFYSTGPHPQGSIIGRFISNSQFQIACYNAPNGPLTLFDPSGKKLWSRQPFRKWSQGEPKCCKDRCFHRNRPIVKLSNDEDLIGYADGGWPWAMNGHGKIDLEFSTPENYYRSFDKVDSLHPRVRGDDIGLGFGMQCIDIDNDKKKEIIIYNRQYLWIYKID